jgi:hypothetical protein
LLDETAGVVVIERPSTVPMYDASSCMPLKEKSEKTGRLEKLPAKLDSSDW